MLAFGIIGGVALVTGGIYLGCRLMLWLVFDVLFGVRRG